MFGILIASSILSCRPVRVDDPPKVVFVSDRDGNDEIYTMLADGSNVQRLTNNPGRDIDPCWSPDGKQIAWASNRTGNFDIWTMDADGGNQVDLTNDKDHQNTNPMWAHSEDDIAFISNRHFYTIRPDGENLYQRTSLLLPTDCEPSLSPLAIRFCFRDANGHLIVREGWEVNQVMNLGYGANGIPAQIHHPSWSSDGQDIVFDSGGPTAKIFTVDTKDSSCDSVAMDGFGYEPVFSNGDTSVIFTSAEGVGKGTDIFSIDLDAADKTHGLPKPTNLTHNPGNDSEPCYWEPPSQSR